MPYNRYEEFNSIFRSRCASGPALRPFVTKSLPCDFVTLKFVQAQTSAKAFIEPPSLAVFFHNRHKTPYINFNGNSFVPERFEYHEAKLFVRQDIHGEDKEYSDLKEAYQITILSKDRFFHDNELVHTFLYYDPVHRVSLEGKTRIVIMELAKARQTIEKPVSEMSGHEAWAAFFRYLTNKKKRAKINEIVKAKEGIAMASEAMITISASDREYFRQLSEEKYILDMRMKKNQARRKEEMAMARGEARGEARGMKKGMAEGLAKGMEKGMEKATIENARRMKALGLSTDQIQAVTKLSIKEIDNL